LFSALNPDPDPNLIRIQGGSVSGSGFAIQIRIQEGKNSFKNIEKVNNFIFEVLDVLFWGLKASPVAWT
jgi:hypothetical protein